MQTNQPYGKRGYLVITLNNNHKINVNKLNQNIYIRMLQGKMDNENTSCAHDNEEGAQISLLDLPVEVGAK